MTIQSVTRSRFGDDDINTGLNKAYQNYLMPTLKLYDAKVSINHWQLRNCVKYSSTTPGNLYYIYDHSIRSLDTKSSPGEIQHEKFIKRKKKNSMSNQSNYEILRNYHSPSELVVGFDYKPRCFCENGGLIACGGLIGSEDNGCNSSSNIRGSNGDNYGGLGLIGNVARTGGPRSHPPSQVEPIKLASNNIFSDGGFNSNQMSWKGILALYNIENGVSLTYKLGQYINNCVELYQRASQQYDLYSCNNDCNMYQCNVSNRGVELTRRFSDLKFALNSASISHDGKTMVVSGDSSKFVLYRQNELNGYFSLRYDSAFEWGSRRAKTKFIPTYNVMDSSEYVDQIHDSQGGENGFCTSFSGNDLQMATIFQNGLCLVYDMRKMDTPLSEIFSTRRNSQNGSFRVCKFSESFDDLLFISEHQSHVHVVDTRNLMNHQVIVIPDKIKKIDEFELVNDDMLSTSRSSSTTNDPCVTYASKIPTQSLEPEVLPYPKVAIYPTSQQDGVYDELTQHSFNPDSILRRRRHVTFRIRRYSTSTVAPVNNQRPPEDIDPGIIDHHYTGQNYRAVDNYNYIGYNQSLNRLHTTNSGAGSLSSRLRRNTMSVEDTIEDDTLEEDSNVEEEDRNFVDFMETYNGTDDMTRDLQLHFGNMVSTSRTRNEELSVASSNMQNTNNRRSSLRLGSTALFSDNTENYFEENSISGIDWVQDQEGSSLVIGTDYGIIKWNINSWARRSFPCYDFC